MTIENEREQEEGTEMENGQVAGAGMADAPEGEAGKEETVQSSDQGGEVDTLNQEIERLHQKVRENMDLALRTQAEMENLRKRTLRDMENAHKFGLEKFVNELLPVIDSLELGLEASMTAEEVTSVREGMELTLKKFLDAFQKFGVEIVDPVDEKFSPERHEAVSMQESAGNESGQVMGVLQKGYELNGRLIRPARVVVAK